MKLHPAILIRSLCLLLVLPSATLTHAQSGPASRATESIRRKANTLAPGAHITVLPTNAPEEFGDFTTHNADTLTFYNIDAKKSVTLPYTQIRKLKLGYGGYNSFARRHTDRDRDLIIIGVTAAGLFLLAIAAARS